MNNLTPAEEKAVTRAIRFARAHGLKGELILRRGGECGTLYLDHLTNTAIPTLTKLAEIEVGKKPLKIQTQLGYGVKGQIKRVAVKTSGTLRNKLIA